GVREAALESGEGPREARDLVGDHALAVAGVRLGVAVRVDQQLLHLGSEALDHVRHHRLAAEGLQSLVDTAHAAALAAGEHDAGDPDGAFAHPKLLRCGSNGAHWGRTPAYEFTIGARSTGVTKRPSGRWISSAHSARSDSNITRVPQCPQ